MRYQAACLVGLCLGLPSVAPATVWNVSSISQLKTALANVNPGDRIDIQ
jgi:hypothetical protein